MLYINGDDYISIHTAVKKIVIFLMMKLSKLGDCSVLLENQRNGMKMSYYISDFCSKVYILYGSVLQIFNALLCLSTLSIDRVGGITWDTAN